MQKSVCIDLLLLLMNIICSVSGDLIVPPEKLTAKNHETQNLAEKDNEGTEVTVENEDEKNDGSSFIPTKEWKEVKSYHKLPAGLHYRMNLDTGLNEAKLLSDDESKQVSIPYKEDEDGDAEETAKDSIEKLINDKNYPQNLHQHFFKENLIEALKSIENEDPEMGRPLETEEPNDKRGKKPKFRSYDTLKAEFEGLHLNIESDSDILIRLIAEYGQTSDEIKVNILEDLDFLIHQIDNAVNFVNMGGIKKIIYPGLNSTNAEIRKGVMRLVGSASQSNPKVQVAAFEEGLLNQLLRIVARERDSSISSKAVFAVSCLVRGFPYGQQKLIESGGLHTLREVFLRKDWQSLTLQLKVVSLIKDLLEERVHAEGERGTQLSQGNLVKVLVEGEWCSAVSALLAGPSFDRRGKREDLRAALGKEIPLRPDHNMVDTVINTMALLVQSCYQSFVPSLPLLQTLKETYSDLAYKERFQGEDGHAFFQELADQIQFLLLKIRRKEEL